MPKRQRDLKKEIDNVLKQMKTTQARIAQAKEDFNESKQEYSKLEDEYRKLDETNHKKTNAMEEQSDEEIRRLEKTKEDLARYAAILSQKEDSLHRMEALQMSERRRIYDLQMQEPGLFTRIAAWFREKVSEIYFAITAPLAAREFDKLPDEEKQRITQMADLEAKKLSLEQMREAPETTQAKENIHENIADIAKTYDKVDYHALGEKEQDLLLFEHMARLCVTANQTLHDGLGNNHVIRFDVQKDPFDDKKRSVVASILYPRLDNEGQYVLRPVQDIGNIHIENGEMVHIPVNEKGRLQWSEAARNVVSNILQMERANMRDVSLDGKIEPPIHAMNKDLEVIVSVLVNSEYERNQAKVNEEYEELKGKKTSKYAPEKESAERDNEQKAAESKGVPERSAENRVAEEEPRMSPELRTKMKEALEELHDNYAEKPGKSIFKDVEGYRLGIVPSKTEGKDPAYILEGGKAGYFKENQDYDRILDAIEGKHGQSMLDNFINQKDKDGNFVIADEKLSNKTLARAALFDIKHNQEGFHERFEDIVEKDLSGLNAIEIAKELKDMAAKQFPGEKAGEFQYMMMQYADAHDGNRLSEIIRNFVLEKDQEISNQELNTPEINPSDTREMNEADEVEFMDTGTEEREAAGGMEYMPDEEIEEMSGTAHVVIDEEMEEQSAYTESYDEPAREEGHEDVPSDVHNAEIPKDEYAEQARTEEPAAEHTEEINAEQTAVPEEPAYDIPQNETRAEEPDITADRSSTWHMSEPEEGHTYRTAPEVTDEFRTEMTEAVKALHNEYKHTKDRQDVTLETDVQGYTLSLHSSSAENKRYDGPYYTIDDRYAGKFMNSNKNIEFTVSKILGDDCRGGEIDNNLTALNRNGDDYYIKTENLSDEDLAKGALFDVVHGTESFNLRMNEMLAGLTPDQSLVVTPQEIADGMKSLIEERYFTQREGESREDVNARLREYVEEKFYPALQSADGPMADVLRAIEEPVKDMYLEAVGDKARVFTELNVNEIREVDEHGLFHDTDGNILVPAQEGSLFVTEENVTEYAEDFIEVHSTEHVQSDAYYVEGQEFNQVKDGRLFLDGIEVTDEYGNQYTVDDIKDQETRETWEEISAEEQGKDISNYPNKPEPEPVLEQSMEMEEPEQSDQLDSVTERINREQMFGVNEEPDYLDEP